MGTTAVIVLLVVIVLLLCTKQEERSAELGRMLLYSVLGVGVYLALRLGFTLIAVVPTLFRYVRDLLGSVRDPGFLAFGVALVLLNTRLLWTLLTSRKPDVALRNSAHSLRYQNLVVCISLSSVLAVVALVVICVNENSPYCLVSVPSFAILFFGGPSALKNFPKRKRAAIHQCR